MCPSAAEGYHAHDKCVSGTDPDSGIAYRHFDMEWAAATGAQDTVDKRKSESMRKARLASVEWQKGAEPAAIDGGGAARPAGTPLAEEVPWPKCTWATWTTRPTAACAENCSAGRACCPEWHLRCCAVEPLTRIREVASSCPLSPVLGAVLQKK